MIRSRFLIGAACFAAGVIVATPHWNRRYLVLGAVLALLALAAAFVSRRKENP